jgi:hypothetical protein
VKEFNLDNGRGLLPPADPTAENILGEAWTDYVNSLSEVPVLDMKDSTSSLLLKTLKDTFKQQFSDLIDDVNFPKWLSERKAWSDGKNGSILIGTAEDTYILDDSTGFFDKIERIEGIITDKNDKKINKYMAKIKKTLRSI